MFIPCDHCLRKHATHVAYTRDGGKSERLQLCAECYQEFRRDSVDAPNLHRDEQRIAEELQANLFPQKFPNIPGYDLSAFCRPARQVGGDYYDLFEIDSDRVGVLVADVSGKGVPAAIVMTETRGLVRSEAVRSPSPAQALHRVNRELYKDVRRGMFVTMYYAVLEPGTGTLTCCSAGHSPMVLWRKESNSIHLINTNGLALAIDQGPIFEKTLKEQKFQLNQGDRIALYTDGVTESKNPRNEAFGQNRFYLRVKQLADTSSSEFLSLLTSELDAHRGDAAQVDDLTILTVRRV